MAIACGSVILTCRQVASARAGLDARVAFGLAGTHFRTPTIGVP
jgi:hypothetical protein